MEFYYLNSTGKKLDFTKFPYLARNIEKLRNSGWGYTASGNKIVSFSKNIVEIPLEINICADNKDDYQEAANRFDEIIEEDILNKQSGKLYFDGQYIRGYFQKNTKADWCKNIPFSIAKMGFISDDPVWVAENENKFYSFETSSSNNKRYPGKYPHRYANGLTNAYVINEHFYDANFLLRIYGPVVNPQVIIGGYTRLVNIVLEAGEHMEIDSRTGTVKKYMVNGTGINAFHNRQKGKTIFRKIQPGRHSIVWTGKFNFDLIIYEERSEPKW